MVVRKRFGQHFLHDPAVIRRIVESVAPAAGQRIVEIGPGRGALTWALLERAKSLDVIEIDRDLAADLRADPRGQGRICVHAGDVLEMDFEKLRGDGPPLRVVGSRSHMSPETAAYLAGFPPHEMTGVGSSLKFCLLAEGKAELYPRFGPTSEWDTAAGQALLEAAGGHVTRMDGHRLRYNCRESLINGDFVAFTHPSVLSRTQSPSPRAPPPP